MMQSFGDARDWFLGPQLGLFIHWGLYAIPAWHEQMQWRRSIPRSEYEKLVNQFNPTAFDPDAWLDLAEAAGMSYLCFTTKHHDGFCLWHSRETDFNVINSPCGKDLLAELAEACHRRSFPLCLYYSVVDWHHPNYPNQNRHHELAGPEPGDRPDWEAYLEFLKAQVRELCTNYGTIHGIWWDMNVPEHRDPSINAMIRALQPAAVINSRGFDEGDFGTPERGHADPVQNHRRVEACQSIGAQSWGYRAAEDYFTDRFLLASIDGAMAGGANFLLNVGPQADGTIPDVGAGILRRIGTWRRQTAEAFDGTIPAAHSLATEGLLVTRRDRCLYVHVTRPLTTSGLSLKPWRELPRQATLLNTGQAVTVVVDLPPYSFRDPEPFLQLPGLPANDLANTVPIIKLEFDSLPKGI